MDVLSQGRAAVYEEPIGPAGVRIRERPRTDPKAGAIAVAIRSASINHLDLWLAHGAQRVTPPRVIAADGAGVVHASEDPSWKVGDEVVDVFGRNLVASGASGSDAAGNPSPAPKRSPWPAIRKL